MRAVVKARAAAGAELQTVPTPAIGPRDILVKVRASTICGTDLHIYKWDPGPSSRIQPPMVFGHEFCGDVVAVGDEVEIASRSATISRPKRISSAAIATLAAPAISISAATFRSSAWIGRAASQQYVSLSRRQRLAATTPSCDPAIAAAQEPFGNAVHTALATELAARTRADHRLRPDRPVRGRHRQRPRAPSVSSPPISTLRRLEMARTMGASDLLDARERSRRRDPAALPMARAWTCCWRCGQRAGDRAGLRAPSAGWLRRAAGAAGTAARQFDLANNIVFKGATVYGVSGRKMFETWYQTRALLAGGKVDIGPIISHRMPLEEYRAGL